MKQLFFPGRLSRAAPLVLLVLISLHAQPPIERSGESLISDAACEVKNKTYGDLYLNAMSYQQDALISYGGWQYATFYTRNRFVGVARRELPNGAWEICELTDYKQTSGDNHNTISMGISPADGRIHLSFDHHNATLHYRKSVAGLAARPLEHQWNESKFGSTGSKLAGSSVSSVTYPRFITAPDSTLLFTFRTGGGSGDGDNRLYRYHNDATWTDVGKFIEGSYSSSTCNAYFHGIRYGTNNRLHAAWCWRESSSGYSNHDLVYVYSDDHGKTWLDNDGALVGRSGSQFITQDCTSCKVWTIPQRSGLINQEGMTVDNQGRVHVLSREDISGTNVQVHYWRDTDGTWHRAPTGIATKRWDNRSSIAHDAAGNVYAIVPHLRIAGATRHSNYSDWSVINTDDISRFYHSEPLVDAWQLASPNNTLYVFAQQGTEGGTSPSLYCLEYKMNDGATRVDETLVVSRSNRAPITVRHGSEKDVVISYSLAAPQHVDVSIFTMAGRRIAVVANMRMQPGKRSVRWHATAAKPGVYVLRLMKNKTVMYKEVLVR